MDSYYICTIAFRQMKIEIIFHITNQKWKIISYNDKFDDAKKKISKPLSKPCLILSSPRITDIS